MEFFPVGLLLVLVTRLDYLSIICNNDELILKAIIVELSKLPTYVSCSLMMLDTSVSLVLHFDFDAAKMQIKH